MSGIKTSEEKIVKIKVGQMFKDAYLGKNTLSISAKTDENKKKIIDSIKISSLGFGGIYLNPLEFVELYKMMKVFADLIGELDLGKDNER